MTQWIVNKQKTGRTAIAPMNRVPEKAPAAIAWLIIWEAGSFRPVFFRQTPSAAMTGLSSISPGSLPRTASDLELSAFSLQPSALSSVCQIPAGRRFLPARSYQVDHELSNMAMCLFRLTTAG
jgi:hypothetical protein